MNDTENSTRRPRGRPRAFDTDAALRRATEVFWRRGYAGAGLAELTAAMGISPPSLYAAFGDKRGLFLAALEHYGRTDGAAPVRAMAAAPAGARLGALLDGAVGLAFAGDEGRGCLAACVAADAAGDDPVIREALREFFARAGAALGEVAGPDGPPGAVLLAAMHALAVRARAGASRAEVADLARALQARLDPGGAA